MMAYRRLRFPLATENLVPARACLANLFRRIHIGTSEELSENKAPEKPKRPSNAYLRFSKTVVEEYRQKNPDIPYKHVQKLIATAWSSLEADKKAEFVKQFKDEQELYKKKLEEYKDLVSKHTFTDEGSDPDVLRLKSEMLHKPKRPPNAFLLYKSSRRAEAESKNMSFLEWGKEVAADWRELAEKEKSVFVDMARKMALEYKSERDAWQQKMIEDGHTDILSVPRKIKGSSAHNVTLQAGQETKTESLDGTKERTSPVSQEEFSNKQSNTIENSRNELSLPKEDIHVPREPILNIAIAGNVFEPRVNTEQEPSFTTATSDTVIMKRQCSNLPEKTDAAICAPVYIKAECSEKTSSKKMHYFDSIHGIANIKTEYVLGATCSLISISLCLWYLSHI